MTHNHYSASMPGCLRQPLPADPSTGPTISGAVQVLQSPPPERVQPSRIIVRAASIAGILFILYTLIF